MGLIRGILLLLVSVVVGALLIWFTSPFLASAGMGSFVPFLWILLGLLVIIEIIYTLF